jgi:hypothetical protein
MGKNSARQTYVAMTEWLNWFNKETGRTKKVVKKEATPNEDKSYKVNMKGFRKQKK